MKVKPKQEKHVRKLMSEMNVVEIPLGQLKSSLKIHGMKFDPKNDAFVMKRAWDGQIGIYFSDTGNPDTSYIAAMHELGHIALKHESEPLWHRRAGIVSDKMLSQEIEAWEWAFENSVTPINDEILLHMYKNLSTYTDQQERWLRFSDGWLPKQKEA